MKSSSPTSVHKRHVNCEQSSHHYPPTSSPTPSDAANLSCLHLAIPLALRHLNSRFDFRLALSGVYNKVSNQTSELLSFSK